MKDIMMSFWFWLLIIGIFLILAAALLAGGLKEINGWVWGLFIMGVIVAILGIILAFVEWNRSCKMNKTFSSSPIIDDISTSSITAPVITSDDTVGMSPIRTPTISPVTTTPMGSPTRSQINIPQAQRGFTSTNISLSSLSQY